MNDLLKLLSKSLKPHGYAVRPVRMKNILRVPALETEDNRDNVTALPKRCLSVHSPPAPDASLDRLIITLRTCVRGGRNIDTRPRISGVPLPESALRCIVSLANAIKHSAAVYGSGNITLRILDDRSDPRWLSLLEGALKDLPCAWELRETEITGQGPSLHEQFRTVKDENALAYFVEDDYLHEPDGITALWTFYRQQFLELGTHTVLYPQEHPVMYTGHYPSYIVLGEDRHWRTIRHATHTLWTHSHIVSGHWDCFENTRHVGPGRKRRLGSEAKTTNRLFDLYPGFAPLKPAAAHFQFENTMPPLYNWKSLWESTALPQDIQDQLASLSEDAGSRIATSG